MSLAIYHQTLSGSDFYKSFFDAGLWALGGQFRGLTNPIMWWFNGSTYVVGYENNVTNNKVWIAKQTDYTVEVTAVNSGTSVSEPLNHPTPLIYINEATGYIYVIQNTFHVDSFEVWKSDNPEDISSFTSVGEFDTDGSYLGLMEYSGTNCTFVTRSGEAPNGYDQNILEVDLDNPSGYTDLLLVEGDFNTNDTRMYPATILKYGTSLYTIGGANLRDESTLTIYIQAVWITQDFDTYENIQQTFSKDVPGTSAITFAEVTTDMNLFGVESTRSASYGGGSPIQVDDSLFFPQKTGANELTIYKYDIGSSTAVASYVLPYTITFDDGEDGIIYLYHNGDRIIGTIKIEDGDCRLFTIENDLTDYSEKEILDLPDGAYLGLPYNMEDVDGRYMIAGRSVQGDNGHVSYLLTFQTYKD